VTQVRSMLRVALRVGADLDSAYTHINDQLSQDLADNRFVTVFLGLLDADAHVVGYHAGGQGPTMHFHAATGTFDWHGSTTMPMGFMETKNLKESAKIELAPGDILGLMTDGVFETENLAEEAFGQEGVEKLILANQDRPTAHVAEIILKTVDKYKQSAPQADDITIVLLRRLPV
jgi:sigma-B regulation protein RsbU (phosphoserine phosphatase)